MAYIDNDDYWQGLYTVLDELETALRPPVDTVLEAEVVYEDILDAEEIG